MKKIIFIVIFIILSGNYIYLSAAFLDDFYALYPFNHAQWKEKVTTISQDGKKTNITMLYAWYKTKNLRKDGNFIVPETGKTTKQILIFNNNTFYLLNVDRKMGLKYTISENNPYVKEVTIVQNRKNAQKIGSETLNGIKCDIYAYNYKFSLNFGGLGNTQVNCHVKEWRNSKNGFTMKTITKSDPYQMKVAFVNKNVEGNTTIDEISNLDLSVPVDDSLFVIDKSYKMSDMDQLINQQQKLFGTGQQTNNSLQNTQTTNKQPSTKEKAKDALKGAIKGLF